MMSFVDKIKAMSHLGTLLDGYYSRLTLTRHLKSYCTQQIDQAIEENIWFTPIFIKKAITTIVECYLSPTLIEQWLKQEQAENLSAQVLPQKVGLITAANIPLVGFHDFIILFFTPHRIVIQPSRRDRALWIMIIKLLSDIDFRIAQQVEIADIDDTVTTIIATGSTNTQRYFTEKFGSQKHLFRTHRTSVALLSGAEKKEELLALCNDILLYFGLGCRNVGKIFVPRNYDFSGLVEQLSLPNSVAEHTPYSDTLRFLTADLQLSQKKYLETPNVLLTENTALHSPIGLLYYEYYDNFKDVLDLLPPSEIQCVVADAHQLSLNPHALPIVPFGTTQTPQLHQYADNVNLFKFLL